MRWLSVAVLITARIAAADDPEAQRLLDEGTRLFTDEAAHEAAREAFEKSYKLEPSWRALNGIALTYQEQGRYLDAIETYEQLLREFGTSLTSVQRETADKRIAALEVRVGRVDVGVEQSARVVLDGREIGTGPLHVSTRVMPGHHVVVATSPGHQTWTRTIDVGAGQSASLSIVLEAERVVVRTRPVQLERPLPPWMPWTAVASGVALAGIGGLLHVAASSSFDTFDASVRGSAGSPPMPVPGDVDARERGELENKLALTCVIAGGVLAIGGGVLFSINQPRPVEIVPTGTGVALVGAF
jgi:hypothetical protein